jgi:exodeoxyribonuclease V beta subunit
VSFDLYGPLPTGTTVLEASAGTGKTYAIAALATRYVAEGVAELPDLMLATFSRAATQELRERVRERLTSTARAIGDVGSSDDLVRHLSKGSPQEVELRRQRLVRAASEFDGATIATTHSFCQQVLDGLGMAGDAEPGVRMVESVDDLRREVVDDLYLRKYAAPGADPPQLTPSDAHEVVRAAVGDRSARLEPADADPTSPAGQRYRLASVARTELERRKRAAGVRDFDDLLILLRDVLAHPERGEAACVRLRERFKVVLVDEFQDTDPVQWEVLRRAFHGTTTLVLIGDPKQAVYAFRGAEVLSYLDAVGDAERVETLGTNWRSDAPLLRGLEHLYGDAALGHPRIVARHVDAAQQGSRMPGSSPLRLRVLSRSAAGPAPGRFPSLPALRSAVATDVAADVVRLLDSGAPLCLDGEQRTVRPGDIAVLVRKYVHVHAVRAALDAAGVPSVVSSSSSVFATTSARDWLWLLQALEQPHRAGRVRLAALTPLVGWTAERLDVAADAVLDEVGGLVREAGRRFEQAGFAAAFELLSARTRLESRLLGAVDGERRLTDLRHLAQVLNRVAVEQSFGLSALVGWLGERVADPDSAEQSERSRRLESDAAAVTVLTVHASKGLEFPVVYVPYGWDGGKWSTPATLRLHDAAGARVLDVGGKGGPGWDASAKAAAAEDDGEELRLLYVALTRAQCQVVAWWAPSSFTASAPLHRLLLGRTREVAEPAARATVPEDAPALSRLQAWGWPDEIAVEPVTSVVPATWRPPVPTPPALSAASFTRRLDTAWRRTSYSSLTAAAHELAHAATLSGSEPELPDTTDEPEEPPLTSPAGQSDSAAGLASPMNGLPAGAAFGTLVHEVLEVIDTTAPDLPAELLARCGEAVRRRLAAVDSAELAASLLPVLHTPLGLAGDPTRTLAGIAPSDRLSELDFELPLGGGDAPTPGDVQLRAIARLLRDLLPADDVLAGYADALDQVEALPLRGYLGGSIDAVLRVPGPDGPGPAYVVVDYKTNRLGRGDLTTLDYTREAMAAEMVRAHYPLQALLYAVALHRYLRWRQPGYDPGRHLGGVQYLFVRGMAGPETPAGCGVFDWHPPASLVVAISDLLAGAA